MRRLLCSFDNCVIDEIDGTYHYYNPIKVGDEIYKKFVNEINKLDFQICLIGGNTGWTDEEESSNHVSLYTAKDVDLERPKDVFIVYDCFLNYDFKEDDRLMCTLGIYKAFFENKLSIEKVIFIE